jgi:hypothetical protein
MTTEEYHRLTRPYLARIAKRRQAYIEREATYTILAALLLCNLVAGVTLTLAFILNH